MPVTPPALTVTGTLNDIFGNADVGSSVIFQLCNYGPNLPRIANSNLLAKTRPSAVVVDNTGAFSQKLYGNDVITPAGTYYSLSVEDENESRIQTQAYQFTGSGSIDISGLIPFNPVLPVPPLQYTSFDYFGISNTVSAQAPASLDQIATVLNINIARPITPFPVGAQSMLAPPGYIYTLSRQPMNGMLLGLYYNGLLQVPSFNYTIIGRSIYLNFYTNSGDNLYALYVATSVN
jgi:hypothetical protein